MLRVTIQDAWLVKMQTEGHGLYLFREGETILYVGRSDTPQARLRSHLQKSSTSKIGLYIKDHMPESLQWIMEMYDTDECRAFLLQFKPGDHKKISADNTWIFVDAENALIEQYRPRFNRTNNPDFVIAPREYLNATQAAKELGVNEKTVRRWIDKGKLEAHQVSKNLYAIPPEEVEKMRDKAVPPVLQTDDTLLQRIEALEREVLLLRETVARLVQSRPIPTRPKTQRPSTATTDAINAIPENVPSDAMLVKDFAELHGLDRRRVLDHMLRLRQEHIALPTNRPNEMKRYLTSEQQKNVLDYWQHKNGTPHTL